MMMPRPPQFRSPQLLLHRTGRPVLVLILFCNVETIISLNPPPSRCLTYYPSLELRSDLVLATMSRGTETRRCDIVFQSARDSFLDTISQEERAQFSNCANVEMLMEDVGAFSEFKSDHRRASKFLERIKNFGDQIQPYFEVCGILLQAHPEWTAIAWGAFRLILKVSDGGAVKRQH